jgi:hypothetical protein
VEWTTPELALTSVCIWHLRLSSDVGRPARMEENWHFARRHQTDFRQSIQRPVIGQFEPISLADQRQSRNHFGKCKMVTQAQVPSVREGQECAPGPIRGGEALGAESVRIRSPGRASLDSINAN